MWNWLVENRTWVFSGIGVAVVGVILSIWRARDRRVQVQKGGDRSTNLQAGGSITLRGGDRRER